MSQTPASPRPKRDMPAANIIVLGGAGDMGSRAVEELAAAPGVARVTIADRAVERAREIARRCRGPARVEVVSVDADRHEELVRAIAGHEVAASALGPFHRFEARLARAAVEAGADYVSVCDEWQAVEQLFDEVDAFARAEGRTVITGVGASPGLTNVGVRYLIDRLHRARRVRIACYQPLDAGGGPAVLEHMMYIMRGQVAVWRDGQRRLVPACSESQLVRFPSFGEIRLWNMGHSEPYTVPRTFPELEEVSFWMGFGKGASLVVEPARWGLFDDPRRARAIAGGIARLERLLPEHPPGIGALRIDVWGEDEQGREAHRLLCGVGGMRDATGLALAVGTLMLLERQLICRGGGVYTPEASLDPGPFIHMMMGKGVECYQDLAMTVPLAAVPLAEEPATSGSTSAGLPRAVSS